MDHLSLLEASLQRMEPPQSAWRKTFHEHADVLAQIDGQELKKIIMAEVQTKARILESEQKLMISLGQPSSDDPYLLAGAWHQALKAHLGVVPSTVFMGGSLNQLMLVVYCRPLVADDFAELWSV